MRVRIAKVKVGKSGESSLLVRLPVVFVKANGIQAGDCMEAFLVGGRKGEILYQLIKRG